jgi:GAF domain-containing protein
MDQSKAAKATNSDGQSPPIESGRSAETGASPTTAGAESFGRDDELARLRSRVAELQKERDHLVAVVDILQEISSSLHFVDILQAIARKLGDAFGLDRCAIFLAGEKDEVRLVASYEDPAIRNLVVDLNRYPELKRAFESKETVFIPDATKDPMLRSVKSTLDTRNVRSIVVVPIQWQGAVIGAIFLRTERDAQPFSDADVHFCQVVASLTAKALRNAHRFETLMRSQKGASEVQRRSEIQRIALIAYVRRLLDRYATSEDHMWAETLLPKASDQELERLVGVAMKVLDEESRG